MNHQYYLTEALKLAQIRKGFAAPNPSVGAVLVINDQIIASGFHEGVGQAHAEVVACSKVDFDLSEAILYVTLEPCCHWGRTPPCTDLIIRKGIKQVYFGYEDPNPEVAGQGQKILQQHGITCLKIDHEEINLFYRSYLHWVQTKKPWVVSKLAISLDAKIADDVSKPVNITGQEAREYTHQGRKRADAILTSAKTIIQDNPFLNVRLNNDVIAKQLFVLDAHLDLPLTANIFSSTDKITVFHSSEDEHKISTLKTVGAQCQKVSVANNQLNLQEVIQHIGFMGVQELWVEAGGKVFSSLVQQDLAQQSYIYVAPKLLGNDALSAFSANENFFERAKSITWFSLGYDSACEILW